MPRVTPTRPFAPRTVPARDVTVGTALMFGRLVYVHALRHEGEHAFASIAAPGHAPSREIRLEGSYAVQPSLCTLVQRFREDDVHDGEITHYTLEEWDFSVLPDTLEEMARAIRRYGLDNPQGDEMFADPDGSQIIDYVTGERETVTVWARSLTPRELDVLIDLVHAG